MFVLLTLWNDASPDDVIENLDVEHHDELTSAEQITGPYDIMVVMEGNDVKALGRYVVENIRTIKCVRGTLTSVVLPDRSQ